MTDTTEKTLVISEAATALANDLVARGLNPHLVAAGLFNAALEALLSTRTKADVAKHLYRAAEQLQRDADRLH